MESWHTIGESSIHELAVEEIVTFLQKVSTDRGGAVFSTGDVRTRCGRCFSGASELFGEDGTIQG